MSENNIDLPMIEDLPDDIEMDDIRDSPEFRDAVRKAQLGQYDSTLFEMWEDILEEAKRQVAGNVSIPLANGLLRQWPWLSFKHLPDYFKARHQMLEEALDVLKSCYPKPQELLYQENEDDWNLHKDAYIDVIVEWTKLSNFWSDSWEEIPMNRPDKAYKHAAVADMVALLVNPSSGLVEQMSNLANFQITEEESEVLQKRIAGVDDE